MTISDRVVDNALYDTIADRDDFEILEIHTTQVSTGTCADLGRSANSLLYVRAYTQHAKREDRQRVFLYQDDESEQAAGHFRAIRDADVERQVRIERLTALLEDEHQRFVNPGEVIEAQSPFLASDSRYDGGVILQMAGSNCVTSNDQRLRK